eukprot:TRINITY_DN19337_c0_g1_i1.p1 TRINITY_DN19337_c0_g1~~TRINITY_DN19337_c0_g1_i1.p1  ORF type:complete len:152 (+),score=10.33 TRINITY_DN19337_c0_g1_i1:174-629(+)
MDNFLLESTIDFGKKVLNSVKFQVQFMCEFFVQLLGVLHFWSVKQSQVCLWNQICCFIFMLKKRWQLLVQATVSFLVVFIQVGGESSSQELVLVVFYQVVDGDFCVNKIIIKCSVQETVHFLFKKKKKKKERKSKSLNSSQQIPTRIPCYG